LKAGDKMKKPLTQSKPILAADDNGFADHKIARYNEAGKIECSKYATSIQIGGSKLTTVSGETEATYTTLDEHGEIWDTYTCSTSITEPLELRNAEYPFSEANRVLAHHAMTESGLGGCNVKLAITLPFSDFYTRDGLKNEEMQLRTIENFLHSNVLAVNSDSKITVSNVNVYPEGMCAFYDWALDEQANMTQEFEDLGDADGSFLIVDIGGSTTDVVSIQMVNDNIMINHGKSGTTKVGVLDVKEGINSAYLARFGKGHDSKLGHRAIQRIMDTKTHKAAGVVHDMAQDVANIMRSTTARIMAYVNSKAGDLEEYHGVLFVGGGAVVFQKALKEALPTGILGDEFANARGMLKYMKANEA
jgi:plasmid segregation protein ParM